MKTPLPISIALLIALVAGCNAPRSVSDSASSDAAGSSLSRRDPASIRPQTMQATILPARQIGTSRQGQPIIVRQFVGRPLAGKSNQVVLIHAGIHGNEQTTVYAAERLIELLDRSTDALVPAGITVAIVPTVNPDGYKERRRQNSAGVDLNRNFPAKNWQSGQRGNYWNGPSPLSEPESRALHDLLLELKPIRIVALHSIRPPRHGNNFDGPARELAELLATKNQYAVLPTMGYPTPGSFGSWAGIDLKIPTVTLEFPSNAPGPKAWQDNREALLAFIRGQ